MGGPGSGAHGFGAHNRRRRTPADSTQAQGTPRPAPAPSFRHPRTASSPHQPERRFTKRCPEEGPRTIIVHRHRRPDSVSARQLPSRALHLARPPEGTCLIVVSARQLPSRALLLHYVGDVTLTSSTVSRHVSSRAEHYFITSRAVTTQSIEKPVVSARQLPSRALHVGRGSCRR